MFLQIDLCLIACFYGLLIIIFYVLLGVSAFLFCVPITILNWIFIPLHGCFLVTAPRTLVIGVLTLHLNAFISLVMSAFMNTCFHLIIINRLQRFPPLPPPKLPLMSSQIYYVHRCSPSIQPSHHKQPTCHSIHPSLAHHHMHVYLTILIQIQLANQSPPPPAWPFCWCWDNLWFFLCSFLFGQCPSCYRLCLCWMSRFCRQSSTCGRFSLSPFDWPRSCGWFLLLSAAAGHLMAIFFSCVAALNQQTPYGSLIVAAENCQSGCFCCRCYCTLPLQNLFLYLMLTSMSFGMMLCMMRSRLCTLITLGL